MVGGQSKTQKTPVIERVLQIVGILLSFIAIFGPPINKMLEHKLERLTGVSPYLQFDIDSVSGIKVNVAVPSQAARSIRDAHVRLIPGKMDSIKQVKAVNERATPIGVKRNEEGVYVISIGTIHPGDHRAFDIVLEKPVRLSALQFQAEVIAENEPLVVSRLLLESGTSKITFGISRWVLPAAYIAGFVLIVLLFTQNFHLRRDQRSLKKEKLDIENKLKFFAERLK